MILIVGLGNPGKKFQKTRHNVGFRIADEFAKKNNFPEFKLSKKFNTLISESVFSNKKIILAEPQTFMNNSGKAVKLLIANCQLPIANLMVVHDDIDLPLGKIRIVKNRGSAGHKGVQSTIDELGTKNFVRFRVGVRPETHNLKLETLEGFVLKNFSKEEEKTVKEVIKKTIEAIGMTIEEGVEKTMSKYNK